LILIRSFGGALRGGVMALLGAMAFQALKGGSSQKPEVTQRIRDMVGLQA